MKNVIAIFDVGKTNKKLLLFDEQYNLVYERSARFTEIEDEDGFPCENVESLKQSVYDSLNDVLREQRFAIKAINFSGYGASFVYLDEKNKEVGLLYNYLKPFDPLLREKFYKKYGGEDNFSVQTASPVLGSLNSGMQLYRLKYEKPALFKSISNALHLPQYLSFLLSGKLYSEMTSIGCHTNLWDFEKNDYHTWVKDENILEKLPPIVASNQTFTSNWNGYEMETGVGLHDSSAALIPYLVSFREPFVLVSTGTWCISLNPFNQSTLTKEELQQDCLCYLQYSGSPVKAARLFAGQEHEDQTRRIAEQFQCDHIFYRTLLFDEEKLGWIKKPERNAEVSLQRSAFPGRDLSGFESAEHAYYQLIADIVEQQKYSTGLVLNENKTNRIFVDGGFSKNDIYMNLLAAAFPGIEVYATSMAQASALGAALAIHDSWNSRTIPSDIIELKVYTRLGEMPFKV